MSSYLIKRAGPRGVVTADGDLVADSAAGRIKLEAIPEAELPEALRKLTPEQRKAEIEKQLAERNALDEKLKLAVRQRDVYVANERRKQPANVRKDSFDQVVEETLKLQVKRPVKTN